MTAIHELQPLTMRYLVRALVKYNASDLHLKPGRPPLYRINGKLMPAKMPAIEGPQLDQILEEVITDRRRERLHRDLQTDFSFHFEDLGRFRCALYYQRGSLSAVIRMIPFVVPAFESLGVPAVAKELCQKPRGLVLITGPTGAGKSTTMASLVQEMNRTRYGHILTIEDPIEFEFRDQKCAITQREVGTDTHSFEDGLYAGLRQDPDVIVIGEMRNQSVIKTVLTAAETGHLVFTTLHTSDAKSTIERVIDVFPSDARDQVRIQLSTALLGVISQHLLPTSDGKGRVAAFEVMIKSPAIEEAIFRNELDRIPKIIAESNEYYRMQTLNQSLEKLIEAKTVRLEDARKVSNNSDDLNLSVSGVTHNDHFDISLES